MDFDRFTMLLLVRHPEVPELSAAEADALQDAHLSYLADLHDAGHMLAAGPLLDPAGELRGLCLFNVGAEQARALLEQDPAVQAGKYTLVVLPWLVPAGAVTYTATHFPRSMAEVG